MSSCFYSHVTSTLVISDDSHRKTLTLHHGFPMTFRRSSVTFPMNNSPSFPLLKTPLSQSSHHSLTDEEREEDPESVVESLRIPDQWLIPSKAIEESEWLRETLHKWLDDEYCPEPTNIEISKVAAKSYYTSLLQKETDMGEVLLKMAQDLTSISYKESFHGAFTSANAAINLIVNKLETELESS